MRLFLLIVTFFTYSFICAQNPNYEFLNAGGQVLNNLSFSIGEIFVIEKVYLKDEFKLNQINVIAYPNPSNSTIQLFFEGD